MDATCATKKISFCGGENCTPSRTKSFAVPDSNPLPQDYAETKFKAERGGKAEEVLLPKHAAEHSGGGTVVLRELGAR